MLAVPAGDSITQGTSKDKSQSISNSSLQKGLPAFITLFLIPYIQMWAFVLGELLLTLLMCANSIKVILSMFTQVA